MEVKQREIDWTRETNLRRLEAAGLTDYERRLVLLLLCLGKESTRGGEVYRELTISKRKAAKEMGCSENGPPRAARRLAGRRMTATGQPFFWVLHAGQSTTYMLWTRGICQWVEEPRPDPLAAFDPLGNAPQTGTGWDGRRTCNREVVGNNNRTAVNQNLGPVNRSDPSRSLDEVVSHPRPWQAVRDHHLRALPPRLLDALFQAAVDARWLIDSHDARWRFYALAFQAATTTFGAKPRSRNPRVACLVSNIKAGRWHYASDEARAWAKRAAFATTAAEAAG